MTMTLHATFDGQVLRPDEPLALAPNTRVIITIATVESKNGPKQSFLQTAKGLALQGPPDWAARLDNYLYGDKADAK